MSKRKPKETDYLFISAYLRALEGKLLTRERMERMLDARTNEDAAKVLSECGYEGLEPLTAAGLEASLARGRDSFFAELSELSPNPVLVDVFRAKYDYHNAKALVKCAANGQDPARLLIDAGRYPAEKLREYVQQEELEALSPTLRGGITAARDTLAATGDPQRSDFQLDRAYFAELRELAQESGSTFLQGYVRLQIDAANLRAAVRAIRMKKGYDFLTDVVVEGGDLDKEALITAATAGNPLEPLCPEALQEAAALGDEACQGGSQTAFERACDNALVQYLRGVALVPFGDGVVIAYAAARENDATAARIILSGRLSGVPAESIRERLREAYV